MFESISVYLNDHSGLYSESTVRSTIIGSRGGCRFGACDRGGARFGGGYRGIGLG